VRDRSRRTAVDWRIGCLGRLVVGSDCRLPAAEIVAARHSIVRLSCSRGRAAVDIAHVGNRLQPEDRIVEAGRIVVHHRMALEAALRNPGLVLGMVNDPEEGTAAAEGILGCSPEEDSRRRTAAAAAEDIGCMGLTW